jgi:hypothetical protein
MTQVAIRSFKSAMSRQVIKRGKTFDDKDPVVKAHPDMFESAESYTKRTSKPVNTDDLGSRSMSARKRKRSGVESARQAPGEKRDVGEQCPDCDWRGTSEHALKIHRGKAHK